MDPSAHPGLPSINRSSSGFLLDQLDFIESNLSSTRNWAKQCHYLRRGWSGRGCEGWDPGTRRCEPMDWKVYFILERSMCPVFNRCSILDSWCPWAYNLSSLCSDIRARAFTMSPEQSQYILHKTKTYPFVRIGWSSLTLGPPKVVQSFLGLTSTQSKRNG